MHFVFLGKQVLMSMKFYVCEGFLTLFLCLFIQGIFIYKQSDVWASRAYRSALFSRFFLSAFFLQMVYFIRKVEIVNILA